MIPQHLHSSSSRGRDIASPAIGAPPDRPPPPMGALCRAVPCLPCCALYHAVACRAVPSWPAPAAGPLPGRRQSRSPRCGANGRTRAARSRRTGAACPAAGPPAARPALGEGGPVPWRLERGSAPTPFQAAYPPPRGYPLGILSWPRQRTPGGMANTFVLDPKMCCIRVESHQKPTMQLSDFCLENVQLVVILPFFIQAQKTCKIIWFQL